MKKNFCGIMIFLSVSAAYAGSNAIPSTDVDCIEPIGLAIDPPDNITPTSHTNTHVVPGENQVTPIDCVSTPYVGVCESLEDAVTTN